MLRRQTALGERRAQPHRNRVLVVCAVKSGLEAVEQAKFLGRRQRRMVGDVVGGAHEIVERQDRRAMARVNEERGDREILVPVAFARPPIALVVVHRNSETLGLFERSAWARPFHMPPRPRAC